MKKLGLLLAIISIGFYACKTQQHNVRSSVENATASQVKSIMIQGERLHYIEKGEGDPLIFIHGGLGDYESWADRMELYSKNHHVIAYSRRYAWPNKQVFDESADYSIRIHANDLYQLSRKLGLKKVDLIGHSYGAFTALAFALDHPKMVRSLVLGEPPVVSLLENMGRAKKSHQAFIKNAIEPAAESFREGKNEEGVASFLKGVNGDSFSWVDVPPKVKKAWMANVPEIWGYTLTDTYVQIKPGKVKALEVPTLLFVGDRSPQWLVYISKELNRLLPNSRLVTLENSSHGLYFQNPIDADRAVMNFLDNN